MSTNKSLEHHVADWIGGLGPWLAPVPSAALVNYALQKHFVWATPEVAFCAAAVIEVLGFSSINTALMLHEWNGRRPERERPAPFGMAAAIVGIYLVTTVVLTIALDLDAGLAKFAPALFPLLALVGSVNIALRTQHGQRLDRIAEADRQAQEAALQAGRERKAEEERLRLERKADREARRQAKLAGLSNETSNNRSIGAYSDKGVQSRRERYEAHLTALLDAYRDNRDLGPSEAARMFRVTRQTIDNWKDELTRRGLIHENGSGLEVIDGSNS